MGDWRSLVSVTAQDQSQPYATNIQENVRARGTSWAGGVIIVLQGHTGSVLKGANVSEKILIKMFGQNV